MLQVCAILLRRVVSSDWPGLCDGIESEPEDGFALSSGSGFPLLQGCVEQGGMSVGEPVRETILA